MDDERVKQIGIRSVYRAGKVIKDHVAQALTITKKGAIDLVTQADTTSEKVIIDTIREAFPDHAILAEERGPLQGTGDHLWIIDPLDGTTNFAHRLNLFAVSIAFATRGQIVMGWVLNPMNGELFQACKGQGAWLNDQPIQVSETSGMIDSLLVTGFPYDIQEHTRDIIPRFSRCLASAQGVRRLGSAALDLCYVACGRFDGYWEENLKPWDVAAGCLIVQEAHGRISDYHGRKYQPAIDPSPQKRRDTLLATNGKIHAEMMACLQTKDLP